MIKMQAIILAAGEGTRLRPYTQLIPKCLMTINGIPLITFHIDKLLSLGIPENKIIVVSSYLKNEMVGFLKRFHRDVNIVEQKWKKGTAAAVEAASSLISEKEIIIVYGDIIFEDDLKEFIKRSNAIGVYEVEDVSRFGKVVEENGFLKEIREKSDFGKGYIFAGLLKTNRDFLEEVKNVNINEKSGEYYLTDAILSYNQKSPFELYKLKGIWIDVGEEKSLVEARKVFNLEINF